MPDPKTINGEQCNEIARRVFYRALEEAERLLNDRNSDAQRLIGAAAVAEACGNDFEAEEAD